MNNNGPVLIVEDDEDDRELLSEIFKNLNLENEILLFTDGQLAYDYIVQSGKMPFLILADIHMPGLGGRELCQKIRHHEKLHYIPFIYFTTTTTRSAITDAYAVHANGFFIKPSTYSALAECIGKIVGYWSDCHSPLDYA